MGCIYAVVPTNLDCLWIITRSPCLQYMYKYRFMYFISSTYFYFLQRACTSLFHFTSCLWIFSNTFLKVLAIFQEFLNAFLFWKNILLFFLGFKFKCLGLFLKFLFPVINFIRLWTERKNMVFWKLKTCMWETSHHQFLLDNRVAWETWHMVVGRWGNSHKMGLLVRNFKKTLKVIPQYCIVHPYCA